MKRFFGLGMVWMGLVSLACAQAPQPWAKAKLAASPRHQEWVTVEHDGRKVQCFVVYPEVQGKAPAVLLIHEIFGLSDWAQEQTDELAAEGYIAIMPDLLSGAADNHGGTEDLEKEGRSVTKAVSSLPPEQVIADLDAAAAWVTKQTSCTGALSVAGFCWGGGKSFAYATHNRDLKAAYVFYGSAPAPAEMQKIQCPVYGFYAGNDGRISTSVPGTREAMKAAGKTYDAVIYDGAGHGFMRGGEDPGGKAGDKPARAAAWKRWLELLKKQ